MNKIVIPLACFLMFGPVTSVFGADTGNVNQTTTVDAAAIRGDEDLTRAIKDSFAADSDLSRFVSNVNVQTVDGVVTLSGNVDAPKTKSDFEAKAKSVAGVKSVINNIEVKSAHQMSKF